MNKSMSIYLDFARFTAACLVFFQHAAYTQFHGEWLRWFAHFGHDAVMVFFVLSGYVISYVAHEKEKDLCSYAVSRFSRLYSVTLVALLLTIILDYVGSSNNPDLYSDWFYQSSEPFSRFFMNFFFLNELWFSSIRAFSNGPYWSLGYEFWYYVVFGAWFYFKGSAKYLFLILACLFAGPKILLLFPIWLLGVGVYRFNKNINISNRAGWVLFLLPIPLYLLYRISGLDLFLIHLPESFLGEALYTDLGWSQRFLSDYLVSIFVVSNFVGLNAIADSVEPLLTKYASAIRWCAGYTFTLYLIHYPLLMCISTLLDSSVLIILSTLLCVVVVGNYTEKKKHVYKSVIVLAFKKIGLRVN